MTVEAVSRLGGRGSCRAGITAKRGSAGASPSRNVVLKYALARSAFHAAACGDLRCGHAFLCPFMALRIARSIRRFALRNMHVVVYLTIGCLSVRAIQAQRFMEALDRGLVAVYQGEAGVFLSWRLLATEPYDVEYNVYRQTGEGPARRLNGPPLRGATNFVDQEPDVGQSTSYFVRAIVNGNEGSPSESFTVPANPVTRDYLSIPTSLPDGYQVNDATVGDLDGDGQYEIVVHVAGRGRDNSQGGITDPPMFHAYKLDGTLMWTINLGVNIREGAHYTQFIVYDLDCDGKAEMVCKTADGTVDGVGNVVGDPHADWRIIPPSPAAEDQSVGTRRRRGPRVANDVGKILSGPEYLTVFDGATGATIDTVKYIPPRAPGNESPTRDEQNAIWGDNYGNRMDRFLATVAYLDGQRPSVVMCRGYYTRTVLAAWDLRERRLVLRWVFDSDQVER